MRRKAATGMGNMSVYRAADVLVTVLDELHQLYRSRDIRDKDEKKHSPCVLAVMEIGEVVKDWGIEATSYVRRGDFHVEVWKNRKAPWERIAVLYEREGDNDRSCFPLSYSVIRFETDLIALFGEETVKRVQERESKNEEIRKAA